MQWLIFSDQRHMKQVPIFYKLGTQGITLQLEDQKVGRGRPQGRRSWTQIPESTVLTPAHLSKIFLSFFPFCFFSFLPCFLFPFKGLFLELSMVPSENRGGPGRNVCLNGLRPREHHGVTFLCVAQLWNLKWFGVPNDPGFLISTLSSGWVTWEKNCTSLPPNTSVL